MTPCKEPMPKAIWNGKVVAQSEDTVVVEGNHYFPRDSLTAEYFEDSTKTSVCGWKGTANYLSLRVDGEVNADAAWYYKTPKSAAAPIKDRVAFWRGVRVED